MRTNLLFPIAVALALARTVLLAQAPPPAATNAPPDSALARFAGFARSECEAAAQAQIFSDLAQEHLLKAEDARAAGKGELEAWETELARQFIGKGSAARAREEQLRKQKAALRQEYPALDDRLLFASRAASAPAGAEPALHPEEAAYLEQINFRLRTIDAEMAGLSAESINFAQQLPTNSVASDVDQLSAALERNRQLTREMIRERADLELKVLEFRALRRAALAR